MSYPPPNQYPGGYPPQQYPPGQYPPQPGYPQQYPPQQYPPQQYPPQPGYPPQQYPPQQYPAQPGYPPQQYPPQPGYPPQQYPPQQPGYPPQQPGYPPQQPGYPPQQPGYPPQTGYPPQQPGYPAQQPGYPAQVPVAYPPPTQYQSPPIPGFTPQNTQQFTAASSAVQHAVATAHLYVSEPKPTPAPFDGSRDAEALYKAMKGLGTDDKVLSAIVAERSRDQLQAIKKTFEQKYGKTLANWIKGETSGSYEDILVALIDDKAEYDAKLLNHSIKGLGTDDDELIEVVCTRNNSELTAMKEAYRRLFGHEAEKDVSGDTSGSYRDLLLAVLRADRPETQPVNLDEAKRDATLLYQKGEGKIGTDERTFIEILTKRSIPQLQAINDAYIGIAGHSLERGIASETSGNFKKAMIVILTPRDEYFGKRIRDAISGVGTKDQQLVRNLSYLSNNKTLFKAVNTWYAHNYKNAIAVDIGGDTSGWYKKTCLALVTNRVSH